MTEKQGEYIRFLNGEVLIFKHFFKEHFPKFFAFTSRFIDDSYVREDIVQETFIIVWFGNIIAGFYLSNSSKQVFRLYSP